ncbi:MAG: M2 family metallopeptidase [Bacteroidales bacterium]
MNSKKTPKQKSALVLMILLIFVLSACQNKTEKMENELKDFIAKWELKVKPLQKETYLAAWNATLTGKEEDYKKSEELQNQLIKIYANKEDFSILKKIRESGAVKDSLLNRQLTLLYLQYQGNQVDTVKLGEVIKMQTEIEKIFNTYRAEVKGKKLSDNDVENTLKNSTSNEELRQTWLSHKAIGEQVADKIKALVKKRNEIAKELGYNNYHEMSLQLNEQDPVEIEKLFDDLDNLTREAFTEVKTTMDEYFAKRYKVTAEDLMPWHYQNRFFQEAPVIYEVDLDQYYKDKDVVKLTSDFYKGIGLDIDDVLQRSDLYEKPGKYQHAYCTDIDNEGDVRVMCNVRPNSDWMNTMLHECGHAAYDKYISMELPFVLRNPAHTFTTEAIAMIMGRFARHPQWIKDMTGITEEEKAKITEDCFKTLRLEQLVFSRWSQVMYRFEKSLYSDPDQDLNQLWWDLVEKYQMIKKPEGRNSPDWATKIHIASAPCYYHNYQLGELLASQLYFHITKNVLKSEDLKMTDFVGRPEVGEYLKTSVFMPGARYFWNDMIEKATGEKLTPKYYAEQFVK